MKKLFLMLAMCMLSIAAFAEDVIVDKNGGMYLCKVIEVTLREIKYKKAGNLDGPTYSFQKSQVKSIMYENGTTEEIAQIMQSDINIKSGKNMKRAAWLVGGSMIMAGLIIGAKASSDYNEGKIDDYDCNSRQNWGYALMGAGALSYGALYLRGRSLERKAVRYQLNQLSVVELPVAGDSRLSASVDVFSDAQTCGKSYGLGICYHF